MNDLHVESYDAEEVAAKKQAISKRVAIAGSATAVTLGLFLLSGCSHKEHIIRQLLQIEERATQIDEETTPDDEEITLDDEIIFPFGDVMVVGGSGSWFISILESA